MLLKNFGIARMLMAAAFALPSIENLKLRTGYGPLFSRPKAYRRINRLNRSQHWRRAMTYAEARALSPFPDRPVR